MSIDGKTKVNTENSKGDTNHVRGCLYFTRIFRPVVFENLSSENVDQSNF